MTNFSYTWETAEIHTRTKYKAGTGHEITADIGVHVGLRGINITLKGKHVIFMVCEVMIVLIQYCALNVT